MSSEDARFAGRFFLRDGLPVYHGRMQTSADVAPRADDSVSCLRDSGFAFVPAARMRVLLEDAGTLGDWEAFARSWNGLPLDTHMADHGRYRRRRHACYRLGADGRLERLAHRAHFQALDYNPLNGGIERWFEPVRPDLGLGPTMRAVFAVCHRVFGAVEPAPSQGWFAEVHQFRIEAQSDAPGLPTPEGMHRDGVDHVLVLLVRRSNVREGTTLIGSPGGPLAGSFTLVEPFDAALVEDRRVHHGVTAVEAVDPAVPASRDVLVVTLKRIEVSSG